ncbi:MAG TPA: ABC transporter permease subunit [Planctomycetota bacterium]|nr:ABC transporter permease subunit [Planctomycetota bacterium]
MRGPRRSTALTLLAVGVLLLTVVAPLLGLLSTSLRITEAVLASGKALRVAGSVTREDGLVRFQVAPAENPDGDLVPVALAEDAVTIRERWSAVRYAEIWTSPRTLGLLWNSLVVAAGGALLALAIGWPVGWAVSRTRLPGRRLWVVLLAGPLLLPPFFAAMGVSTSVGRALEALGLTGGALQMGNAIVVFAGLLFPIPAVLVGRALAGVPAGLVEAARIAAGPATAAWRVVLPAVLPAALAGTTFAFVTALCDFAVPDILGTFLTGGAVPVHVFATEVFLQWTKYGNAGRAVATGAPFVVVVLALLTLTARWARHSPAGTVGGAWRPRPLTRLGPLGTALALALVLGALVLGLGLPVASVVGWGFSPWRVPETIRATAGVAEDAGRWLALALSTTLVATAAGVAIARLGLRGGRAGRFVAATAVALPLAVPGMVLMVGTLLLWVPVPASPNALWKGVLVLTGRTLPWAVLAATLALREADPGLEEAARLSGASRWTLAKRVWGPLAARGIVLSGLLVLVLALRELDAVQLIVPGLLPVRIYDKVHFGRTADVADLSMAYLAILLVPALLAVLVRPRRGEAPPQG